MDSFAFRPTGDTQALAASNVSTATPIQVLSRVGERTNQNFLVTNSGSTVAYLAVSPESTVAAVAPTAGSPANGIPILGNSAQTFTFGTKSYFAVITASGTTTVYITPGDGL